VRALHFTFAILTFLLVSEATLNYEPVAVAKKVAVVGGGPAGLAAATVAAQRGHSVALFEASPAIGGQFKLAVQVPGKEEFAHSLSYYEKRLAETNVDVRLNTRATRELLEAFDVIVLATGVGARIPDIPGLTDCGISMRYDEVLRGEKVAGQRVAIIGAGGIGFDTAAFLAGDRPPGEPQSIDDFNKQWGVATDGAVRGGLTKPQFEKAARTIYLLQRKPGTLGANLSKTTGWIHRTALKNEGVVMMGGVTYKRASRDGLLIETEGKEQMLQVDSIVICAGQNPVRDLVEQLRHKTVHMIGGAHEAKEVDAKAAIREGSVVASKI
jgi:2,4-dienoyl-CoA reductase (NADPH2)